MIELSTIHMEICNYYKVDYMIPFTRSRKTKIVYLRQLFHYLSKELNNSYMLTFSDIGNYLSDIIETPFDHTTVMHSVKKINDYLTYDKQVIKDVETLTNNIKEAQIVLEMQSKKAI